MAASSRRHPGRAGLVALVAVLVAIVSFAIVSLTSARADAPRVTVLRIDGVINVFTADYITGALDSAKASGSSLVVIGMDTPGGIDSSMRRIIQAILASPLPVAVYVSPSGGRAASAGLYISQSADVLAMAPGTNIGSAHPVFLDASGSAGGSGSSVEDQKVLNDSVAYIQGLANLHHRNADWAVDAVKNSVNVTAEKAVELHVADRVSPDMPSLLRDIDGQQLTKNGQSITVHSAGAVIDEQGMNWSQALLHALADPQVAYLFFLLAILAIGFEVTHPGAILPGVIGVISGLLALVAFESLPVSLAGIALVAFALLLFAADVHAPTHGVLTTGGVLALALGSFLILDAGSPFLEPNIWLAVLPPLGVGLILAFLISRAIAARRRPNTVGVNSLLGAEGEVREDLGPEGGLVMVDGALWQANAEVALSRGARVRVKSVEGLRLMVDPA